MLKLFSDFWPFLPFPKWINILISFSIIMHSVVAYLLFPFWFFHHISLLFFFFVKFIIYSYCDNNFNMELDIIYRYKCINEKDAHLKMR